MVVTGRVRHRSRTLAVKGLVDQREMREIKQIAHQKVLVTEKRRYRSSGQVRMSMSSRMRGRMGRI